MPNICSVHENKDIKVCISTIINYYISDLIESICATSITQVLKLMQVYDWIMYQEAPSCKHFDEVHCSVKILNKKTEWQEVILITVTSLI